MRDLEMATKDSLPLAANQTREVFVLNRAAHRDGGLRFGWLRLLSTDAIQSAADRTDQITEVGRGDGVPGHVGGDDLRRELSDRTWLLRFLLFGMIRHGPVSA